MALIVNTVHWDYSYITRTPNFELWNSGKKKKKKKEKNSYV